MTAGDAHLWRVVGGGDKGGIIARVGEDVRSDLAEERLATGALLTELAQPGDRLHFRKLCGSGPAEGWVSLRLQSGKALVERVPALWRVVSTSGALVRTGSSTSEEVAGRLPVGSFVAEEQVVGGTRLQYRLRLGEGPATGWVSIALQQKALLQPVRGRSQEIFELLSDLRDPSLRTALLLARGLQSSEAEEVLGSLLDGLLGEGSQACFRLRRKTLRVLAAMCLPEQTVTVQRHMLALLAKSFADPDATVRCEAALVGPRASKTLDLPEARDFQSRFLGLLRDPCWRVRFRAASSALRDSGHLGLTEMLPELIKGETDLDVLHVLQSAKESSVEKENTEEEDKEVQLVDSTGMLDAQPRRDLFSPRKLRILLVHGANSNSAIMKFQSLRFMKAFQAVQDAEWICLDAPLIWQEVAGADDPIFREPSQLEKTISKGEPFRAWYSHGNGCYNFVDEGVDGLLSQVQAQDPVDVLLCFSQGSNCVSLALDRLRRKGVRKAPWALTVMFSGGQIDDPIFSWPVGWLSDQPTLRVYTCKNDGFFEAGERSLRDMYSDLLELSHEDGHAFPHSEPRAAEIYACAQLEPIFNRLAEDREHVKISKMFSYVLRHAAHKLDVRIRKDGFVRLKDIMELKNFRPYNLEELMACVYFDEKERYTMVREFDGELLIRANQGHTMKVVEDDLLLEPITDPSTVQDCVHGTYLVHWPFIKKQGLSKVARNHIHLAPGLPEDGKIRGMRSTAELFLYVDVPAAMLDGMIFYRSKNEVILTQGLDGWLPVKYFIKAVKINYSTCDIEELDFDRNVNMPNWAAELAPSGPGEAGSYMVKNLEALIANCRKRMAEINELKAQVENGQHLTEEEQSKVDQYAAVYVELQSLEQRFRQHKGYRRESTQEKELRAKEEAEAATVVQRKDRAATPPWEKGKTSIESTAFKATDREKAEWAAIGKRRETALEKKDDKKEVKEDRWDALGRGRLTGNSVPTPTAEKAPPPKPQTPSAGSENWRFGGSGAPATPSAGTARPDTSTPAAKPSGPPRFFNSKLQQQKEQKEQKEREEKAAAEAKAASSWRDRDSEASRSTNWRDRPAPEAL
ncbi:unnamed protein product [Symbiodinium sp. CCMP2456]|nr:unnamed protein product [Symbiodinium sp. CCMP2456]